MPEDVFSVIFAKEDGFLCSIKKAIQPYSGWMALCHNFDLDYRFRLMTSPSNSSTVVMIFEFAW